jgi:DNA-binding NtrC family response regulator
MKHHILIVDDDLAFRIGTVALLEDHGIAADVAIDGQEARQKLGEAQYDLVLSDLVMPGTNGIELLKYIQTTHPGIPVIMVTGFASVATAVEAMRLGAHDYITKPCDNDELLIKIQKALREQKKDLDLKVLREELRHAFSLGNMVSRASSMRQIFRQIEQAADADVTVLIQGESGTGKELVARALHFNSKRSAQPFVAVNCSAIPESLLESELFGHEKGAFTGAIRQRAGKFEEASSGTLFLDEIGDISTSVQTKLLRVLQEKTVQRVGGEENISVETRIVAATNRNLEAMMIQGDFREDLYYRLNVFPISLPPLRERLEDIPELAEHFLRRHADLAGGKTKRLAPNVITEMMGYTWRGNIRELENLIRRAILKSTGDVITSLELPTMRAPSQAPPANLEVPGDSVPYKEYMSRIIQHGEETYLLRMLAFCKGNVNQAAKMMDIDRKTVYRKMAEFHIEPSSFRD